jgi:hypothetical protein
MCGCGTWYLVLWEELRLRVFEKMAVRNMKWRKLQEGGKKSAQ